MVKNENTVVSSLISKEQAQLQQLESMVDKTFEGSMPAFIAAFANSRRLSKEDVDQLEKLIRDYKEEA